MVFDEGNVIETKPAIKSATIQGALLSIIGSVASYLEAAGKLPIGGAAPILALAGGLLSILGRLKAKNPISGLFF